MSPQVYRRFHIADLGSFQIIKAYKLLGTDRMRLPVAQSSTLGGSRLPN